MCIMKKSLLLIVLGAGLVLISCEKQELQPRANANVEDAPVWESSAATTAPTNTSGTTVTDTSGGEGSDSGGITDPNDDEDGNGRKKV